MTIFPEATYIVMICACFIFTGFFALLMLPDIILTIFYLAPKTLGYIYTKKLQTKALWSLIGKPLTLLACVAFLLGCAFILNYETGVFLVMSPVAIACWAITVPMVLWIVITKKKDYLSRYYTGIYMEYLTESERNNFRAYVMKVDSLSIQDAQKELENGSPSFLERKALTERILLLQGVDFDKR